MSQNIKHEWTEAIDDLRFSPEAKERMIKLLMSQSNEDNTEIPRKQSRKLLLIALAAALALITFTGATVLTRWSKSMNGLYGATQEQREIAEKSGVSSMLETKAQEQDILSATDHGVTITAVQTIVDQNYARLIFRVEGFDLPEGEIPDVTIGSIDVGMGLIHCVNYFNGFYDGTTINEDGEQVYADGTPLQYLPDGSPKLLYAADDGSLEFYTTLTVPNQGNHIGKVIEVEILSIGTDTRPSLVRGSWKLKWTLEGSRDIVKAKPHTPIGDEGITLLEAEISPIAISMVLMLDQADPRSDRTQFIDFQNSQISAQANAIGKRFVGIRTTDGTLHLGLISDFGFSTYHADAGISAHPEYADEIRANNAIIFRSSKQTTHIIDPKKADALLFLKTDAPAEDFSRLTEEDLYIIPLH